MSYPAEVFDLKCAECGSLMELRRSKYGLFYGCSRYPKCKGAHGAHANGAPLGTPADKETKRARIRAHAAFDDLWKFGGMKRKEAYHWLRKAMDMTRDEAHIGKFTIEQCEKLIGLVEAQKEER